jgi:hypothetical protein
VYEKSTDQFSLGQTTLLALAEQVRRQLQGQRTYFFPGGGGAIGCEERERERERSGKERQIVILIATAVVTHNEHFRWLNYWVVYMCIVSCSKL